MAAQRPSVGSGRDTGAARFPLALMHAAATQYYLHDATQAEVADRLGVSRATVSRLLSEARRQGLVRIEVPPLDDSSRDQLAADTATALGLRRVDLAGLVTDGLLGAALAPVLGAALRRVELRKGDVLLVASGRTIHEVVQHNLPQLPGVVIVPTVGGQNEPEPWYQINEITRQLAVGVGGVPTFLFAPALPGPDLHARLLEDESTGQVIAMWERASCAMLGIGGPPLQRGSISHFVPADAETLRTAVGDVCLRFFDGDGKPVEYPGSDRLIAIALDTLRAMPVSIGVAVGTDKVAAIVAASRARYINQLVTDVATAVALVDAATSEKGSAVDH